MANLQIKAGFKINLLTFIRVAKHEKYKQSRGLFLCECGNETEAYIGNVTRNHTKSCGCHRKKVSACLLSNLNKTHGQYNIDKRLVAVWNAMKSRCNSKKTKNYHRYGGMGIKVCKEWNDDFLVFQKWCYENGYKKSLQIDRIKGYLGYSPQNCRFVTCKQNNRNRKDNIILTYNGVTKTLPEFAEDFNIRANTLRQRLSRDNMNLHDALNKPV